MYFFVWLSQIKYVADDSTMFWAVGADSSIIVKHAEFCGKEIEMVVPFEVENSGEVTLRTVFQISS